MSASGTCGVCKQGFTLAGNSCNSFADANCYKMNAVNTHCELFK